MFARYGGVVFADVTGTTTATVVSPSVASTYTGSGSTQVTATGGFTFALTGGAANGRAVVEYEGFIKVDGLSWDSVHATGYSGTNREPVILNDKGEWNRPDSMPGTPPLLASDTRSLSNDVHTFTATSTFSCGSTLGGAMTPATAPGSDTKTLRTGPMTAPGGTIDPPPHPGD